MAQGRISSFIVGGIIGAGVALLFAPRAGKETRAFFIDKAEDLWGEGSDLYSQGYEKIKTQAANVQKSATQANDELKTKIENARNAIADQIAKNAQSARDAINSRIPIGADKIDEEADIIKGHIDNAADTIKSVAADLANKDAAAVSGAAEAKTEAADAVTDADAQVATDGEPQPEAAPAPAADLQ